MEYAVKDKLARLEEERLDEERERRRKQRARDALQRIDAVGKQTLLLLRENALQKPGRAEGEEGKDDNPEPGRLSRVLFEAAVTADDPRRAARRNRHANRSLAQRAEEQATRRRIDQAMQTIRNAVTGTASTGLKEGLESAARQVNDVVAQVSTFARGAMGMPDIPAQPLGELVTEERAETEATRPGATATLDPTPDPTLGRTREGDPTAAFAPRGQLGERGFEMTLELGQPPRDHAGDASPGPGRDAMDPL
ncbi:MAG TPA: hypothetical protein VF516_25390, partial [Kofleriaceae bacterium]